jgi:NAD(P)-dependent dehydrogenase (short-subunit alcohol dehydrogenase family)
VTGTLLITGGGRGIGAATALGAAKRGYAVAVNYASNHSAAVSVVAAIRADGGRAVAIQADVANEADVAKLFAAVDAELGRVTALVNNAGTIARQMRVEDMTEERIARVFAVNVTGAFLCAREAVRRMSTRHGGPGGAIVNVSSAASRLGSPGEYIDYAASKAAIDTMTIGLAKEVAEDGIRVNAVRPGIIETEIHALSGEPDRPRRMAATIPMKRAGTAEEVAETILWLLSNGASYVTGAIVDVAGGR